MSFWTFPKNYVSEPSLQPHIVLLQQISNFKDQQTNINIWARKASTVTWTLFYFFYFTFVVTPKRVIFHNRQFTSIHRLWRGLQNALEKCTISSKPKIRFVYFVFVVFVFLLDRTSVIHSYKITHNNTHG